MSNERLLTRVDSFSLLYPHLDSSPSVISPSLAFPPTLLLPLLPLPAAPEKALLMSGVEPEYRESRPEKKNRIF